MLLGNSTLLQNNSAFYHRWLEWMVPQECLGMSGCHDTILGKLAESSHTVELLDSSHFLTPHDWFSLSSSNDLDLLNYILQLSNICCPAVNAVDLKGKSST